jgi:hypothetical protein
MGLLLQNPFPGNLSPGGGKKKLIRGMPPAAPADKKMLAAPFCALLARNFRE